MGTLFRGTVIVSLVAAWMACDRHKVASDVADEGEGRQVFVSLVEKGSVDTFYNRLATPDAQVVVTAERPSGALDSVSLPVKEGHRLYLVEPFQKDRKAYRGEVERIGDVRIVAVPDWVGSAHAFLEAHDFHAEAIGESLRTVASSKNLPIVSSKDLGLESSVDSIEIDGDFVEEKLRQLSGKDPFVADGEEYTIRERGSSEGRRLARLFLRQEYEALGYTVSEHDYGGGVNFVAERTGADPSRFLIVSAHYDSVRNAGADDDGSGTITALATAKALKDLPLAFNLRILGFDQEELGLVGSEAYARELDRSGEIDRLVGVINVEMTGYDEDGDGGFHVIDCNENTSRDLTDQVMEVLARDPLGLRKVEACTNRSDHAAFWRYDKPAVVLSQNFFGGDSNPCYHRSCDTVDRLNWDYMNRLSTAVARATARIVVE